MLRPKQYFVNYWSFLQPNLSECVFTVFCISECVQFSFKEGVELVGLLLGKEEKDYVFLKYFFKE